MHIAKGVILFIHSTVLRVYPLSFSGRKAFRGGGHSALRTA